MTGTGLRGYTATTTMHASEQSTLVPATTVAQRNTTATRILSHACCHERVSGTVRLLLLLFSSLPDALLDTGHDMADKDGGLSKFSGRLLFFTSVPLPEASDGLPMGITRLNRWGHTE
jgi:hypothetical protein